MYARRSIAVLAASALTLGACAAFQASPTTSTCTSSQNDLVAAETALGIAQVTLATIEAGQTSTSKTEAQAQADVTAAQTVVASLQAAVSKNCASASLWRRPFRG